MGSSEWSCTGMWGNRNHVSNNLVGPFLSSKAAGTEIASSLSLEAVSLLWYAQKYTLEASPQWASNAEYWIGEDDIPALRSNRIFSHWDSGLKPCTSSPSPQVSSPPSFPYPSYSFLSPLLLPFHLLFLLPASPVLLLLGNDNVCFTPLFWMYITCSVSQDVCWTTDFLRMIVTHLI